MITAGISTFRGTIWSTGAKGQQIMPGPILRRRTLLTAGLLTIGAGTTVAALTAWPNRPHTLAVLTGHTDVVRAVAWARDR